MKTFLFFLLVILLAFNIQSCKQPTDIVPPASNINCDSNNTVLIPEDMKARFYFKEGTYWIYKNIETAEIDSIWVWKSGNEINPTNPKISEKGLNKCYEGFGLFFKNKAFELSNNYYYTLGTGGYPQDGLGRKDELYNLTEVSAKNNYLGNIIFYNKGGLYEENNSTINLIDSMYIQGTQFLNLLNLNYVSGTNQGLFIDAYYSKNIGLVKFQLSTDNSVWELIRYNINQ